VGCACRRKKREIRTPCFKASSTLWVALAALCKLLHGEKASRVNDLKKAHDTISNALHLGQRIRKQNSEAEMRPALLQLARFSKVRENSKSLVSYLSPNPGQSLNITKVRNLVQANVVRILPRGSAHDAQIAEVSNNTVINYSASFHKLPLG